MKTITITQSSDRDIKSIMNPPTAEVKGMPDHRFHTHYEGDATCPKELRDQIEFLVKRIDEVVRGVDPIVAAYKENNLFIEEARQAPSDFKMGDLLHLRGDKAYSKVHYSRHGAGAKEYHSPGIDVLPRSVLGYAFTGTQGAKEFPALADEESYAQYRLQLVRGASGTEGHQFVRMSSFLDEKGVHRGFPILFLVSTGGLYSPHHAHRYLETEEERKLYDELRHALIEENGRRDERPRKTEFC